MSNLLQESRDPVSIQQLVVLATSHQTGARVAHLVLGASVPEDAPIISGTVTSPDGTRQILVHPADFAILDDHQEQIRAAATLLVILESWDTAEMNLAILLTQVDQCQEIHPTIQIVFFAALTIPRGAREQAIAAALVRFPEAYTVWGLLHSYAMLQMVHEIIGRNGDLSNLSYLRNGPPIVSAPFNDARMTNIPVFQTHPNHPASITSGSDPCHGARMEVGLATITERHRTKGKITLAALVPNHGTMEEMEQLEHQIWLTSEGDLETYFATLESELFRHRRLLEIANSTPKETILGKRERLLENPAPDPKKPTREADTPTLSVAWLVKRRGGHADLFSEEDGAITCLEVSEAVARILEARFRKPSRETPFLIALFPEIEPGFARVDLGRMTVNHTPGSLLRQFKISEQRIQVPDAWFPQTEMLQMVTLDPSSPLFQEISDYFVLTMEDLDGVELCGIQMLQNVWHWMLYQSYAGHLEVISGQEELIAQKLFFGPQTHCPARIHLDGMPSRVANIDANQNWGLCPHLADHAWYAHDRAYRYRDLETGIVHHQIMMVEAELGFCQEREPTPNITCPAPATLLNHMTMRYHSSKGTYRKADLETTVYAIHTGRESMLPYCILDYVIQKPTPE